MAKQSFVFRSVLFAALGLYFCSMHSTGVEAEECGSSNCTDTQCCRESWLWKYCRDLGQEGELCSPDCGCLEGMSCERRLLLWRCTNATEDDDPFYLSW